MTEKKEMKSIWFLVGIVMFSIGSIVLISGIFYLIKPIDHDVKMSSLHTNIWWGLVIIIIGLVYILSNKNKKKN